MKRRFALSTATILIRNFIMLAIICASLATSALIAAAQSPPTFNIACDSIGLAGTPFVRGINCRVAGIQGYPRQYIVYVPHSKSFKLSKESPVVFHYHGSGGGAENTALESGWSEKAEEVGFVAVFGSALPYFECASPDCTLGEPKTYWNNFTLDCGSTIDCRRKPPGYPESATFPADDVKFTDIMLADVQSGLLVDSARIYLSGFSSGGGMVLRLAVDRSWVFAAAASAGPGALDGVHAPSRNMPLYYAIGNRDGHLVDAVNGAPDAPVPPITEVPLTYDDAFGFSAIADRFDTVAATFGVSDAPSHIWEFHNELRLRYRTPLPTNIDGNEVIVSIQGGVTHQFPNAGDNPEGFDDPDIFWRFFQKHPFPK